MRFQRTPSTRNTVKTATRQRMLFAGFCLAVALLVGITTFLMINFGRNDKAQAALGNNMGFENGLSGWTSLAGVWNTTSTASQIRTGGKAAYVQYLLGADFEIKNNGSTITSPATGTNYMVVTAYAKSNNANGRVRVGVITSGGTKTWGNSGAYQTVSSTAFSPITVIIPVSNNVTYSPLIAATGVAATDIYIDDVHIYASTSATADVTAPTAPVSVAVTKSAADLKFNWSQGTDAESGVDGIVILRRVGAYNTTVSLNNQAQYSSSNTAVGPTTVGAYTVVYAGNAVTTFLDNNASSNVYSYLVYTRDKAYNYTLATSAPLVWALQGANLSLSSDASLDGLYVSSGNTFTIGSSYTLTLRNNAAGNIYGTMLHQGVIVNGTGTSINVKNGGLYKFDRDGGTNVAMLNATWESGSTCEFTGIKFNTPNNITQTFHHFKWNSQQVSDQDLPSGVTVNGDFSLIDGGPGASERILWLNGLLTIKGNFYCSANAEFKCRAGNYIRFNGSTEQTIQVVGSTCRFKAIETDNNVKMLCNATLDSLCRLTSGELKLNGYTIYHENKATIVKALGKLSTGLLTAVNAAYKYNLVYERGGDTDEELTTSTTYLNDLTISVPTGEIVKLKRNAYVNGTLYLVNGKLQTDLKEAYVLNNTASAVSYTSSSYVFGNLRRAMGSNGVYAFPVGTSTNQQCATVNLHNITGLTTLLAKFTSTINGAAPNVWVNGTLVNTLLNGGFWTLTPDAQPTGGTYDITLYERGYTNPVSSTSFSNNLFYAGLKRTNSTSAWVHEGNTVGASQQVSGGTVSVPTNSLSTFADFAIAYGNTVLPITLSAFNATLQTDETVRITWTTSAEINNAYFSLERSVNGTDFEIINEQQGAGTSTTLLNYAFTDLHPVAGTNYYRIKQVDFDGTSTYGPVRQVTLTGTATGSGLSSSEIGVYPNPSNGTFTFTNKNESEITGVIITDIKGQVVLQQTFEPGSPLRIDLNKQPSGIYMASFTNAAHQAASLQLVISR